MKLSNYIDSCWGHQSHFSQGLLKSTNPSYNKPLSQISLSQRLLQSIAINGYVGVHLGVFRVRSRVDTPNETKRTTGRYSQTQR